MNELPELVPLETIAERLAVPPAKLRAVLRRDDVPLYCLARGVWRVELQAAERWLERKRVRNSPQRRTPAEIRRELPASRRRDHA